MQGAPAGAVQFLYPVAAASLNCLGVMLLLVILNAYQLLIFSMS